MKRLKSVLAAVLAVVMVVALVPSSAGAAGATYTVTVIVEPTLAYDDVGAFSNGLAAVKKGNKFGYINTEGELVIPLEYDSAESYYKNYAIVSKSGKYGLLNAAGTVAVPLEYDMIDHTYPPDRYRLVKGGKMGFAKDGKVVVAPVYDFLDGGVVDGLIYVEQGVWPNAKKGFINNTTGQIVIPIEYDSLESSADGLLWLGKGGKYGAIDKTGKIIVPFEYDSVVSYEIKGFADAVVKVSKNGKYGYIYKGKIIVPVIYEQVSLGVLSDGLALVESEQGFFYIDITGKIVLNLGKEYSRAHGFSDGLAMVWDENWKLGFINKQGDVVIPFENYFLPNSGFDGFSEGLALVGTDEGNGVQSYMYIDKTGNVAIDLDAGYEVGLGASGKFQDGLAVLSKNGKLGVIDKTGKVIVTFEYDNIYDYVTYSIDYKLIKVEKGNKYGLIDRTGKVVLQPVYDWIDFNYAVDGLIGVEKDGKDGYVDKNGKVIIPIIYNAFYFGDAPDGLAFAGISGKFGFIDKSGNVAVPLEYDTIRYANSDYGSYNYLGFSNGYAAVKQNGLWGIILISEDSSETRTLTSITVKTQPAKTTYAVNELLDPDGLTLTARYSDGSTEIITGGFSCSPATFNSTGTVTVTVEYKGKTATFTVTVEDTADSALTRGADAWAVSELEEAIAADLIPDGMIGRWTAATNRVTAADAIVRMFEAATGKSAAQIAREHGWTLEAQPYSDTRDQNVAFLKAAGITNGVGGGKYGTGSYTRAQMVTMIGRGAESILGKRVAGRYSNTFSDVPTWAADYVGYAEVVGITDGVGGGRFNSDGVLQNQHTGVFAIRAVKAWK
ncbi:MAG: WG repeat-containing protein [Oscillospiraceae bacterium]|jgi:hypothetical protein|nr:WG repeat-containing protein [Oscillospiraceae bacterium]